MDEGERGRRWRSDTRRAAGLALVVLGGAALANPGNLTDRLGELVAGALVMAGALLLMTRGDDDG